METKESDVIMEHRVLMIILKNIDEQLSIAQLEEKRLEAKRIWKIIKDDLDELVEDNITYKLGKELRELIVGELNCYAKLYL